MKTTITYSLVPLLGLLQAPGAVAGEAVYSTMVVTECFNRDGRAGPTPTFWDEPPAQTVTVEIPGCEACNCEMCHHTKTYVTNYPAFCATGVVDVPYTVYEVYAGMSAVPEVVHDPGVAPPGFKAAVETCDVCGDEPVVRTMTYPVGGAPYVPIETSAAHCEDCDDHAGSHQGHYVDREGHFEVIGNEGFETDVTTCEGDACGEIEDGQHIGASESGPDSGSENVPGAAASEEEVDEHLGGSGVNPVDDEQFRPEETTSIFNGEEEENDGYVITAGASKMSSVLEGLWAVVPLLLAL